MTAISSIVTDTPEPNLMVQRVFRVAEIITRNRLNDEVMEDSTKNSLQKQARREIEYCEGRDQQRYP